MLELEALPNLLCIMYLFSLRVKGLGNIDKIQANKNSNVYVARAWATSFQQFYSTGLVEPS